jgi:hypothetical protein
VGALGGLQRRAPPAAAPAPLSLSSPSRCMAPPPGSGG